jgi:hypothetical protein
MKIYEFSVRDIWIMKTHKQRKWVPFGFQQLVPPFTNVLGGYTLSYMHFFFLLWQFILDYERVGNMYDEGEGYG